MKRLSITLTEEAFKIYESWRAHDRSKNVSQAIVRFETMKDADERMESIEARLAKLEQNRITRAVKAINSGNTELVEENGVTYWREKEEGE